MIIFHLLYDSENECCFDNTILLWQSSGSWIGVSLTDICYVVSFLISVFELVSCVRRFIVVLY